jgi:hypothetical protein
MDAAGLSKALLPVHKTTQLRIQEACHPYAHLRANLICHLQPKFVSFIYDNTFHSHKATEKIIVFYNNVNCFGKYNAERSMTVF